MTEPRIVPPEEARKLAAEATPGPWWTDVDPSPHPRWIHTAEPIVIDEADWGPEGHTMYRLATNADDRAWRYADVNLIAAAPDLAYTAAVLGGQREAVLALHARDRFGTCEVCMTDDEAEEWYRATYPCPTARALGVTA
jgi:hypothetical protein